MDVRHRLALAVIGMTALFAVGSREAEAQVLVVGGTSYSTIQAAVNAAASGDTVLVLPGTYKEVVTLKGGVRLHANYEGRPSAAVIIDARGLKPAGANDYAVGWPATTDPIELVGFTIINDGTAILVRGANHLIAENVIDHADGPAGPDTNGAGGAQAIYLKGASHCVLQNNRVYGRIEYGAALRLKNGSENLLKGNSFEGNQFAVHMVGGAKNRLEHNTLSTLGIGIAWAMAIEGSPQTVLKFNTLRAYDTGDHSATALQLSDSPNTRVSNSILKAEYRVGGSWGIVSRGSSTVTVDHSDISAGTQAILGPGIRLGAGVIFADPQFVSSGSDFRLLPTSPARDAGMGKDLDGTRADLGAYGGQ